MNERTWSNCSLVVLLGPPGVGKGTLADFCVTEMGFRAVSTGQILREHITNETSLGEKVKRQMTMGQLVDDSLVDQIFESWFVQQQRDVPVLLDGYPRTVQQANFLLQLLRQYNLERSCAVFLMEADVSIVKARILGRLLCVNRTCGKVYAASSLVDGAKLCQLCGGSLIKRGDDNTDVALRRLNDYLSIKKELVDFFKQMGVAVVVSDTSQQTPEEVFGDFKYKISCALAY